jgi:hypothetical protein
MRIANNPGLRRKRETDSFAARFGARLVQATALARPLETDSFVATFAARPIHTTALWSMDHFFGFIVSSNGTFIYRIPPRLR